MKNRIFVLAIAMALSACGANGSSHVVVDSLPDNSSPALVNPPVPKDTTLVDSTLKK